MEPAALSIESLRKAYEFFDKAADRPLSIEPRPIILSVGQYAYLRDRKLPGETDYQTFTRLYRECLERILETPREKQIRKNKEWNLSKNSLKT